jgi:hypothetical protein
MNEVKKMSKEPVVCKSDDHWEGRNLLHTTLVNPNAGSSRSYNVAGDTLIEKRNDNTPLYYGIDAPLLHRRREFTIEAAERIARPVVAFLQANGIEVSTEKPDVSNGWKSGDLVHVFANGSYFDPHATDLPTVVMLPKMSRKVWNLVRFPDEPPRL